MAEMEVDQDDRPQCERRISFIHNPGGNTNQDLMIPSPALSHLSMTRDPFSQNCLSSISASTTSCYYQSDSICSEAFRHLDEMRKDSLLCDVVLRVDQQDLPAHKCVLAATSPYFRAMFTGNLSESRQSIVQLQEVDPAAVEALIQFSYTGSLDINENNVQLLIMASGLIQLPEVQKACCQFLARHFHPSNCLGIVHFAELHGCSELHQEACSYAWQNFSMVVKSDEFLNLSPAQVISLIGSNELGVSSEEDVFEAVCSWVKRESDSRIHHFPILLEHVRLLLLSRDYLLDRVAMEELMQVNPSCKDLLIEAMKYHLLPTQRRKEFESPRCQPRKRTGPPKVLLIVGGQAPKAIRSVEMYDLHKGGSHQVGELQLRRCRCGVTVNKDFLYVVGGFDGTTRIKNIERLHIPSNKWESLVPMSSRRSTLGVSLMDGYIYAVGGFDGTNGLQTVERFHIDSGKWSLIEPMTTRRSSVGIAVLGGYLYAVGGYDGHARQCLNTVERYDAGADSWSLIASMECKRSGAAVAVLEGMLYVIGGHDGPDIRNSVEFYDPTRDVWTTTTSMHTCRRNAAATVVHGFLYVVGGDDGTTSLDTIEMYDSFLRQWKVCDELLIQGRSYAGLAVIDKPTDINPSIFV